MLQLDAQGNLIGYFQTQIFGGTTQAKTATTTITGSARRTGFELLAVRDSRRHSNWCDCHTERILSVTRVIARETYSGASPQHPLGSNEPKGFFIEEEKQHVWTDRKSWWFSRTRD